MRDHIALPGKTTRILGISLLLCILVGLLLYYIQSTSKIRTYRQSRILLDTVVDMIVAGSDEQQADQAMMAAFREMQRIESLLSKYQENSQIAIVNQSARNEPVFLSPETYGLVQRSLDYSILTDGLFDITIGGLVDLWGIGTSHEQIPDDFNVQDILPYISYKYVTMHPGNGISLRYPQVSLDPGGIAKGYSIDRAIQVLEQHHITSALVNAGGDIRCIGEKPDETPWRIGIKHPRKEGMFGVVELRNTAVATSGDYERFFIHEGTRYHHLLDPRTGMPARECQSVTILAQTAEKADTLATAVFIMGPIRGLEFLEKHADLEGMIIQADGEAIVSSRVHLSTEVIHEQLAIGDGQSLVANKRMELKTFKHGIHPAYYKELTNDKAPVDMPLPTEIIIPLQQHIGAPCKAVVKAKDEVSVGDVVGDSEAFVSSPVHSSVSGVVTKIEPRPHPGGTMINSVVITTGEGDQALPERKEHREVSSLSPEEIKSAVRKAGLVGLGGAGFPTHVKLSPPKDKPIDTVVINGAECEPYLTSDHRMMLEQPEDLIYGTRLIMHALGAKKRVYWNRGQ